MFTWRADGVAPNTKTRGNRPLEAKRFERSIDRRLDVFSNSPKQDQQKVASFGTGEFAATGGALLEQQGHDDQQQGRHPDPEQQEVS